MPDSSTPKPRAKRRTSRGKRRTPRERDLLEVVEQLQKHNRQVARSLVRFFAAAEPQVVRDVGVLLNFAVKHAGRERP